MVFVWKNWRKQVPGEIFFRTVFLSTKWAEDYGCQQEVLTVYIKVIKNHVGFLLQQGCLMQCFPGRHLLIEHDISVGPLFLSDVFYLLSVRVGVSRSCDFSSLLLRQNGSFASELWFLLPQPCTPVTHLGRGHLTVGGPPRGV